MIAFRALALGIWAGLIAAAPPARAQAAGDEQQQLDAVEQQIETSRQSQQRLATEISAAIEEQEALASRLAEVSRQIQTAEASASESESELLRLNQEQVLLMANLGEKQDALSDLLAGLQRLEQNPPPALVVEPHDVLAALRGAMIFGAVVPELRGEAERLTAELTRLEELRASIRTRKQELDIDLARLATARRDLGGLIARKKQMVASGNASLAAEQQRAAQLAAKARTLKQLVASLAEEQRKSAAELARKTEAAEAERLRQEQLLRHPRTAFADARGRLNFPAQGRILRRFGEPDGLGGESQGLVIATRTGAQVTSPADGDVEFAGPFRSYGQVVILNPGGGYRILLAGLDKVTAATGEFLRAGEPVGEMGSGPSSVTLLGDVVDDGRPVLYIEFRNSTDAIDSGPWWIGGMKEARG